VAFSMRDIKTLLLGNLMAFSYRNLVWHLLTLSDRDHCAEFSGFGVALGICEGVALMMRHWVTLRPLDRMALSARLGIWNIYTFLAWNGVALLKRNVLTDLLGHCSAFNIGCIVLTIATNLLALLFIDCCADTLSVS